MPKSTSKILAKLQSSDLPYRLIFLLMLSSIPEAEGQTPPLTNATTTIPTRTEPPISPDLVFIFKLIGIFTVVPLALTLGFLLVLCSVARCSDAHKKCKKPHADPEQQLPDQDHVSAPESASILSGSQTPKSESAETPRPIAAEHPAISIELSSFKSSAKDTTPVPKPMPKASNSYLSARRLSAGLAAAPLKPISFLPLMLRPA